MMILNDLATIIRPAQDVFNSVFGSLPFGLGPYQFRHMA
jgi:hypothetical protein